MCKIGPFLCSLFLLMMGCSAEPPIPKDLAKVPLIPHPVSRSATGQSYALNPQTKIYVRNANPESLKLGKYLAQLLSPATGFPFAVIETESVGKQDYIALRLNEEAGFAPEAYRLDITSEGIQIEAGQAAGLFYGIQTLRQLLPPEIEQTSPLADFPWLVASGTITDEPTYPYRGAMLDVARHFFPPDLVKRYIDYLAFYKMNRLHLHLADDQGWRIEIKSWPKLALHGGSTEVGGGKGGYYSQEDYADLVQYAQDRFITIVPEIDMPGHTNAALASYAELNCDGKARELYTGTEVGFSTLCTDKEMTYQFVDDVIRELAALTPGEYLHIGGDESHVTPLEDYIPFINRVQKIVAKHGKKVVGWDEIAHAQLTPQTVVQWWAKAENAQKGIAQGAKVLASPAHKAYLDMQYDSTTHLGLHWAAYIEVDSAYIWDLASIAQGIGQEHIIGIEAPLWTETITNLDELEYMVFPRLLGYAEIGWTP
ncbi:MAG: beta-N-acetylhexosaminidase, partial [Bacteroidota bacterium]